MATLTVTAYRLGPLSVDVIDARGETSAPVNSLSLSSNRESASLEVPPGDYAVVATRPNGEVLAQRVSITTTASVDLAASGHASSETLSDAAERGLVPSVVRRSSVTKTGSKLSASLGTVLTGASGTAGRNLKSVLVSHGAFDVLGNEPFLRRKSFYLVQWQIRNGSWSPPDSLHDYEARSDYLGISLRGDANTTVEPRAVGLLNERGYGPVVMVPPFKCDLRITFLADGVAAEAAGERISNPSAVRVPVAIALPQSPMLSDLLSALASASFSGAENIWDDRFSGSDDDAFALLVDKTSDPAAALLAAHFLARFAPKRVPVQWLENLRRLLPSVADTHLLLAMRVLADRKSTPGGSVEDLLRSAEAAPACLFSRTRALLTQAMRLRKLPVIRGPQDDRAKPGDFLNVSADAGGFEAFWGSGPLQPGEDSLPIHPLPLDRMSRIFMEEGAFLP
ncbi:hypothetical protein ACNJYD_10090 [Bradyrhizobium sp. DASA03005]|uniref:hypothetical protein n=1 Tax=Bradyrhizobium sp. SPXBL-02 TaxID=3395912 RepID=UPI003F6F2DBA